MEIRRHEDFIDRVLHRFPQHRQRPLCQRHQLGQRLGRQILDTWRVPVRDHHQVAIVVGIEIKDHEACRATVDDQVRRVVGLRGLFAEDASRRFFRACNISVTPGDPEIVHG